MSRDVVDTKNIVDLSNLDSWDLIKELNNYSWLERKSSTPIDNYNHAIDALRYAVAYQLENPNKGNYFVY